MEDSLYTIDEKECYTRILNSINKYVGRKKGFEKKLKDGLQHIYWGITIDYNIDIKPEDSLIRKILHSWHFAIVTQYTIGYGYVYPITTRGQIMNTIHILLSYYLLAKDLNEKLN